VNYAKRIGEQRHKIDVVAVRRPAPEALAGKVNSAIEGAVRRLGYTVPTTEKKDAVTAEWMFSSVTRVPI